MPLHTLVFCYNLWVMARKKGNRFLIGLECTETGERSYVTFKNKINTPDKLQLMKFSKKLRKHTLHKEVQRLK
jgi:large subunit ribosomal protein L33